MPSPILYGDYVYLMTDKGLITCLDAKTGEVKYEGGASPVPASFMASPVAYDGKILLFSEDGDAFVIKAGPGPRGPADQPARGADLRLAGRVATGRIFIRGEQHLYAIGRPAGS